MGTDITVHTEVKINGVWHHYGQPFIPRNYAIFAMLSGERNELSGGDVREERHIVPSRLKSDDLTLITELSFKNRGSMRNDIYQIDSGQIAELENWYRSQDRGVMEEQFGYLFDNGWHPQPKLGVEEVRWIFWYD